MRTSRRADRPSARPGPLAWQIAPSWIGRSGFCAGQAASSRFNTVSGATSNARAWPDVPDLTGAPVTRTGPSRPRRTPGRPSKDGSIHHLPNCGNGFSLVVELSAANVNDHLLLAPVLDRVRPLREAGHRDVGSRPSSATRLRLPQRVRRTAATRDHRLHPRRGTRDKVTAGRWIVEHTFALLHQYRRLAVRWERRIDIHCGS
ncbi:transposase [Nocardia sp. NPDC055053]